MQHLATHGLRLWLGIENCRRELDEKYAMALEARAASEQACVEAIKELGTVTVAVTQGGEMCRLLCDELEGSCDVLQLVILARLS